MLEKLATTRRQAPALGRAEIATRRKLVDWLCETGESVQVVPDCTHRAVVFLDRIMAENTIAEGDMQPLAMVCLLISAKLTEKDRQVAQIKAMFLKRMNIAPVQIRRYETQVLSLLRWDLQCVTAMDFLQLFASQGILFSNDRLSSLSGHRLPNAKTALTGRQYTEFFADMCLQEYSFLSVDPIHLAGGIIAAARRMLHVEAGWSHELSLLTGLPQSEIKEVADEVFRLYNRLFPKPLLNSRTLQAAISTATIMHDDKENAVPAKSVRIISGCGVRMAGSRNNGGATYSTLRYV